MQTRPGLIRKHFGKPPVPPPEPRPPLRRPSDLPIEFEAALASLHLQAAGADAGAQLQVYRSALRELGDNPMVLLEFARMQLDHGLLPEALNLLQELAHEWPQSHSVGHALLEAQLWNDDVEGAGQTLSLLGVGDLDLLCYA